jgi:hypothetical protein
MIVTALLGVFRRGGRLLQDFHLTRTWAIVERSHRAFALNQSCNAHRRASAALDVASSLHRHRVVDSSTAGARAPMRVVPGLCCLSADHLAGLPLA